MAGQGTELATAYVSLVASAKGLGKSITGEIDGVAATAGASAGSKAGDSFLSSWKGKMALVGTAAVAGTAVAGAAIGRMGLEAASQFEQAGIAFKTFLGPAADDFVTKLKDFAANTPFQFGELQQYASKLLSVGTDAASIIPIMTAIGDAASSQGLGAEAIGRATTALAQMQTRGKVTAEDMQQLVDAGVPAWDALAAKLGTDVAGAQQKVTDGTVKAGDMFAALETKAGPALGRVSGMMDAQSDSLAGLWSSFQDTLGQGLAEAFGPAIPAIKDVLGKLAPAIAPILSSLGQLVGPLSELLIPVFEAMNGVLQPLIPPLTTFVTTLATGLSGALTTVMPSITKLLEALTPILPIISDLATTLLDALAPVIVQVADSLAPFISALVEGLKPVLDEIKPDLPQITDAMVSLAKSFGDILVALLPILVPLMEVFAKIESAKWKIFAGILDGISWVFEQIATAITNLVGGDWQSFWDTFVNGLRVIGDFFGSLPEKLGAALDFLEELPGKAVEAIGNLAHTLWDKGGELINGLWEGLKSKLGEVLDGLGALASPLVNAFKDAFGIHSPSKLMMPVGAALADGLWAGFDKQMAKAGQGMASTALSEAQLIGMGAQKAFLETGGFQWKMNGQAFADMQGRRFDDQNYYVASGGGGYYTRDYYDQINSPQAPAPARSTGGEQPWNVHSTLVVDGRELARSTANGVRRDDDAWI